MASELTSAAKPRGIHRGHRSGGGARRALSPRCHWPERAVFFAAAVLAAALLAMTVVYGVLRLYA